MWEEILRLAIGNGLWAVLFCCLLAYSLRDSRAREAKYQKTIEVLSEHLDKIDEVIEVSSETLKVVKCKKVKVETAKNIISLTATDEVKV